MIRELFYMGRWKVFDNIVHQFKGLQLERNRTKKAIFKLALWIIGLIILIAILNKHNRRHH